MKRLLAYLFIVLGLGLTFNVSAEELSQQELDFKNGKEIIVKFCFRKDNFNYLKKNPSTPFGDPFKIIFIHKSCKDVWAGYNTPVTISYKKYLELAASIGYKKNYQICYRPEKKEIKSNKDKEFINIVPSCSDINGYEIKFVKKYGSSGDIFTNIITQIAKIDPSQKQKMAKKISNPSFDVDAKSVILIDSNSNEVLYEKNADTKISPASMTKIMTTVIAFDLIKKGKLNLNDKFLISEKAWKLSSFGYSSMFLLKNDKVSIENLLRGIIVASGNDACIALAEGIAGTEENFVKLMNKKANQIGLKNTNFANSTGINNFKNYSTVRDIAILSSYMIKNYPKLYSYYSEKSFVWNRTGGDPIKQGNRNPLLYKNMLGVDGIKTGYLSSEKYQLASSMKLSNNQRLISVGSGFPSKNARSKESAKLLTWAKNNYQKFQIAKAEPSQTQKVANSNKENTSPPYVVFCKKKYKGRSFASYRIIYSNKIKGCKYYDGQTGYMISAGEYIHFELIKALTPNGSLSVGERTKVTPDSLHKLFSLFRTYESYGLDENLIAKVASTEERFYVFKEALKKNGHKLNKALLGKKLSGQTQIAKKEPTITPKKKVKVAKVEDSTQEEFKPKKTNQDNEAPVIEIAENITVDSQTYTLKGKVKDKSRFQLTIDDRTIKVAKNGQFEFEGFAIDSKEQLKIVAIDRWKNKSEKIINIEVKIKQVADLRSYEKPNPSKIKVKKDNNKIGIIVGIEKYQNLNNIDAPYANRDAKAFKAYANIALGIPNNNLKVLIDEDATRGELLKSLKIWLPQITRGKGKDIYIFFAGHGLASDNGEDLHILPHNGDPILLEDTALSRIQMFDLINKVSPKSVTMFFDTCYSGQTRSEQMLVAGLRPLRIVADEQDTPNNFTIFTASNYDQTSGSINEAEHGIFSYYLMKGLEGNADTNKDKKLTNGELIAYLKNKVSQEAFTQNRSQEPMLAGDPDKVLMSYR